MRNSSRNSKTQKCYELQTLWNTLRQMGDTVDEEATERQKLRQEMLQIGPPLKPPERPRGSADSIAKRVKTHNISSSQIMKIFDYEQPS
jgi:hypothetical protein